MIQVWSVIGPLHGEPLCLGLPRDHVMQESHIESLEALCTLAGSRREGRHRNTQLRDEIVAGLAHHWQIRIVPGLVDQLAIDTSQLSWI
ncbi:hypothetical protein D9M71_289820 [compost metagenome]